uniref:Uncharacterized protein n=1 Tax=viral metagenome TaxID=1070528 RepID=A0A6C0CCD0_9ZZZZ
MYPIQNTDIIRTIIEYYKMIAGCILYRILISFDYILYILLNAYMFV